ncbi:MAG: SDR family NAD(P)-dependent oxidoreductase, partial [Planctomycetota bacterium]
MSPDNQVVIVSGGSRGLGSAIVTHLLDSGRKVATFSRKPSPFVESLKSEPRFFYQAIDATNTVEMCGMVRETVEKWGRVDALVNNAAIAYDGVLALMNEEHIERMLQVNLTAAIILAKECSRQMLLTGGGSIINISSIIAQRGFSGLSVYAATKSGMIGFTKSLA